MGIPKRERISLSPSPPGVGCPHATKHPSHSVAAIPYTCHGQATGCLRHRGYQFSIEPTASPRCYEVVSSTTAFEYPL
jgi:hypothetical protein